jgi:phosphohistidine phosphatase SixA
VSRALPAGRAVARFGLRLCTAGVVVLVCALALAACVTAPDDASTGATFVIVRHAEKATDDPRDPELAPAGEARAGRLARMLADAPLTAVYATAFRRTRLTAEPVARMHGLPVTPYDAKRPPADTAAELRARHPQGTVLVVAHSNTAPDLAAVLCGCEVEPLPESEYGRYYRLTAPASAKLPARLEVLAW